jgi:YHS domain-containing protein
MLNYAVAQYTVAQAPVDPQPAGEQLRADWAAALCPESLSNTEVRQVEYRNDPTETPQVEHRDAQPETRQITHRSETAPRGAAPALDGYCPVMLIERDRWVAGDPRCNAMYHGRLFLFSGPEPQQKFLASPDRYAPACAGNDPVVSADEQRDVPGKTQYSLVCDGQIYLFSDPATLKQFRAHPERYVKAAR